MGRQFRQGILSRKTGAIGDIWPGSMKFRLKEDFEASRPFPTLRFEANRAVSNDCITPGEIYDWVI